MFIYFTSTCLNKEIRQKDNVDNKCKSKTPNSLKIIVLKLKTLKCSRLLCSKGTGDSNVKQSK